MLHTWRDAIHRQWHIFRNWHDTRKDVLMFITQGLIAFVGIGSMWIIYHVSSKQNTITEKSLELTREYNILDSKPYVFPYYPSIVSQNGREVAILPFVNSGKTPAYKFRTNYHFWRSDTIQNPTLLPYPFDSTAMIIPPNSVDTFWIRIDTVNYYRNNLSRYYLLGKLWYDDVWQNSVCYTFSYEWIYFHGRFRRHPEHERMIIYEKPKTNE